ncbi:hypothetical protein RHS03_06569, partial [Rhizoctonia solani]
MGLESRVDNPTEGEGDMEEIPETDEEQQRVRARSFLNRGMGRGPEEMVDLGAASEAIIHLDAGENVGSSPESEPAGVTGLENTVASSTNNTVAASVAVRSGPNSGTADSNTTRNLTAESSPGPDQHMGLSQRDNTGPSADEPTVQPLDLLQSTLTPAPYPPESTCFRNPQRPDAITQSGSVMIVSAESTTYNNKDLLDHLIQSPEANSSASVLPTLTTVPPQNVQRNSTLWPPFDEALLRRSTSMLERMRRERAEMASKDFQLLVGPQPPSSTAVTINPPILTTSGLSGPSTPASAHPAPVETTSIQSALTQPESMELEPSEPEPQSSLSSSSNAQAPELYLQTDFDGTRRRPRVARKW